MSGGQRGGGGHGQEGVSLALLAIAVFFWYLIGPAGFAPNDRAVIDGLVGLAFGASLISIFARLGGGWVAAVLVFAHVLKEGERRWSRRTALAAALAAAIQQ